MGTVFPGSRIKLRPSGRSSVEAGRKEEHPGQRGPRSSLGTPRPDPLPSPAAVSEQRGGPGAFLSHNLSLRFRYNRERAFVVKAQALGVQTALGDLGQVLRNCGKVSLKEYGDDVQYTVSVNVLHRHASECMPVNQMSFSFAQEGLQEQISQWGSLTHAHKDKPKGGTMGCQDKIYL